MHKGIQIIDKWDYPHQSQNQCLDFFYVTMYYLKFKIKVKLNLCLILQRNEHVTVILKK